MAVSKLAFLNYVKLLMTRTRHQHHQRHISFATPEDAAANRRQRIESQPRHTPNTNPNLPILTGKRLDLHNLILKLIQQNNLHEAERLTRHCVYSDCRPTIFTCNTVMAALLRRCKHADVINFSGFIADAKILANIVTYNLIMKTYMDWGKTDTALHFYSILMNNVVLLPDKTTYRILVKGLAENHRLQKAVQIKQEMLSNGFEPDPIVYCYLMCGELKNENPDGVFILYEELKEKLGGVVDDGVVYGRVMKAYFLKGMEKEAMVCYHEAQGSKVTMSVMGYNSILEALTKNGKLDSALKLFDKMLATDTPKFPTVNRGSYNLMVDFYCAEKRFDEAIEVFIKMGGSHFHPDTLSFNNLIKQLCNNGMLAKAQELYNTMNKIQVSPDEYTFVVLMDTCFKEDLPDEAAAYMNTLIESKLSLDLTVYNRLIDGLVKAGKIDEAKSFFDVLVLKLEMDDDSYKFMMKALSDNKKHDEVLEIIGTMMREQPLAFSTELQVFVKGELKKQDREDDLRLIMVDIEEEKEGAKARDTTALSSLTNFIAQNQCENLIVDNF